MRHPEGRTMAARERKTQRRSRKVCNAERREQIFAGGTQEKEFLIAKEKQATSRRNKHRKINSKSSLSQIERLVRAIDTLTERKTQQSP